MRFTCSTDINAPRDQVVFIFLDPEKQHFFQDGFLSKELLSGSTNSVGAQSKLIYKRLELIETIEINNLPDEFQGLYEHKHTTNTMNVKFIPLNHATTRYDGLQDFKNEAESIFESVELAEDGKTFEF